MSTSTLETGATGAEQYRTRGDELLARVKELVRQGNVRRIVIRNEEGRVLVELPLTVGVVGTVLMPMAAAIGAIGALVADCTIEVQRSGAKTDADVEGDHAPMDDQC